MENIYMKTLRVSDQTHKELTGLGSYSDSMDDIIKKLIESYKKHEGSKK